jgi:TctA family transporter
MHSVTGFQGIQFTNIDFGISVKVLLTSYANTQWTRVTRKFYSRKIAKIHFFSLILLFSFNVVFFVWIVFENNHIGITFGTQGIISKQ